MSIQADEDNGVEVGCEDGMEDYLANLEEYEERLAHGDIQW